MLTIWTAANADMIRRVVGPVIGMLHPVPEHQVVPIVAGQAHRPKAGEVCLAMGTKALEALQQIGVAPKNRTVTSLRGKVLNSSLGGQYLMSFDPNTVESDAAKYEEIAWDIRLADRLNRTGSLEPETGVYSYVDDLSGVVEAVKILHERTGKPVDAAFDLETHGLYPWYPDKHIVTVQWSVIEGASDVYRVPDNGKLPAEVCNQLQWLLTTPMVSLKGANLKFDLLWVQVKWAISCTNFKFDTLLVGSLLDENRSNSLNGHAKTYTSLGGYDDPLNDTVDKSDMPRALAEDPQGFLVYAGGDTDACLRTAKVMRKELLKDPQLANFYVKLLHPAARAFEKIERNGILVNREKMEALSEELRVEIDRLEKEAIDLLPGRLRAKYSDNLKLSRNVILEEFFFGQLGLGLKPKMTTEKSGKPSTAHAHLQMFADVPEAARMCTILHDIKSAQKTKSTFVDGFIKVIRPDGRLHPTFYLANMMAEDNEDAVGSTTGRLSAKEPPIQTVPKKTSWAKKIREAYEAPKGMSFIQCLPQGTLVSTERGLVPIEQVVVGDRVVINDVSALVTDSGKTGVNRDLIKATMASGRSLRATGNHPVLTVRDGALTWVPLEQIIPGDVLLSPDEGVHYGSDLNADVAYVAGLFYGDGHYGKEQPYAAFSLGLDADELKPVIEAVFSRAMVPFSVAKGDYRVGSKSMLWFQSLFPKNGSHDLRVPACVWQADEQARRAFLSGAFDSDGGVTGRRVAITSVCRAWVEDLALLALSVGVHGVVETYFQKTNFAPEGVTAHKFIVYDRESLARFPRGKLRRKAEALGRLAGKAYTQCRTAMVPMALLEPMNTPGSQSTPASNRMFQNGRRKGHATRDSIRAASESNPRLIGADDLLCFRFDEVRSVEDDGQSDVYDLTVEEVHAFVANGYIVHNCDFDQGELKVTACYAPEPRMLEAYQSGKDLHCVTAASVNGYEYDEFLALEESDPALYEKLRGAAKPANFGLLYGMGAEGFQAYAWASYGLKMSLDEATKIRDGFFGAYPGLPTWHENMKRIVRRDGFVASPLGRVRHLPLIWSRDRGVRASCERQAINFPIQSTLTDLMIWGCAILQDAYPDLEIVCTTHDSLWAYVPEDEAIAWIVRIKEVLENLPIEKTFGWAPQLKFTASGEYGPSLAKLKKYKG